jgi:hypothetical protein
MRVHHRTTLLGLRVLLAGAAAGAIGIACGGSGDGPVAKTNQALGSCGPGQMPGFDNEGCVACSTATPGSATDYYLDSLFKELNFATTFNPTTNAPEYSYYAITNGVGSFVPPQPSVFLPFTIPTPPSQSISLPGYSGSNYQIVVKGIPSIVVTWGAWTVGTTGVTLQATMTGAIDAHVTYDTPPLGVPQIGADVAVNIGQLPITITFNTDSTGDATLSSSGVQISSFTSYVSVSGCSVLGIDCDPIADGFVGNAEPTLQSFIASELSTALNGQNDATPFWKTLMTALANAGELLDTNNTSYTLPAQGTSSAAGTVSGWVLQSMDTITTSSVTGNFSSGGICYVGCTSLSVAQACASQPCGATTDGCGNTIQCPDTCTSGQYCSTTYGVNACEVLPLCPIPCATGYICEAPNGYPGTCVVNHRCPVLEKYCNGACINENAYCP